MNRIMRGVVCAAAALGGFAWGFFMGRRAAEPAGKAKTDADAKEEQRAFTRLMGYSAADAYGLEGVSER